MSNTDWVSVFWRCIIQGTWKYFLCSGGSVFLYRRWRHDLHAAKRVRDRHQQMRRHWLVLEGFFFVFKRSKFSNYRANSKSRVPMLRPSWTTPLRARLERFSIIKNKKIKSMFRFHRSAKSDPESCWRGRADSSLQWRFASGKMKTLKIFSFLRFSTTTRAAVRSSVWPNPNEKAENSTGKKRTKI